MATEIKIDLQVDLATAQIERFNKSISSTEKQLDDLKKQSVKTQDSVKKLGEDTKGAFDGASSSISSASKIIAGAFAFNTIKNFFSDAINEAVKFENALIGIKSVAGATGNDIDKVGKVVKDLASDGLIPLNEVASSLKSLLASGLDIDQSVKLFNALKDSAAFNRQGFLSLGEAVTGATQGIKNGISVLVDNAGITKNLSILEKEYAESIGTTVGKLTEAQRIQARYVGILKEASIFSGDAAKLTDTYSGSISKLSSQYNLLLANIGEFFTKNKLVLASIELVSERVNGLNQVIGTLDNQDKIKNLNKNIKELQATSESFGIIPLFDRFILGGALAERAIKGNIEQIKKLQDEINKEQSAKAVGKQLRDAEKATDELISLAKGRGQQYLSIVQEVNGKEEQERKKLYDKLKEDLKNAGLSELQILKKNRDEGLAAAKDDADLKSKILIDYAQKKKQIEEKSAKQSEKTIKDSLQKQTEELNRFKQLIEPLFSGIGNVLSGNAKGFIGNAVSSLGSIGGLSADSIKKANAFTGTDVISKAASFIGPQGAIIAQAAGPILELLSQGKEAVKGAIEQFSSQLPDLLVNIVEGIAEAIPLIIEKVPEIINRLIELLPQVIESLGAAMPRVAVALSAQMPTVAVTFATSLIAEAPNIAKAIIESIAKAPSNAGKSVGKLLKFSDGGIVAGNSLTGDRINARINSGEMVLNREQQRTLFELANGKKQNGGNMAEIMNAMMNQPVIVQVDGREIARAVRGQVKQGFII